MRFPWYWFREQGRKGYTGPKDAAFILENGKTVKFRYDNEGMETARKVAMETVVAICDHLQDGTWSAQWSKAPFSDTMGYLTAKTLKDCVSECLRKRERLLRREQQVQDNPNLLLAREIRHRDWYSHMSDDFRYWAAGNASDKRIEELLPKCDPNRVRKIWARYAPKEIRCPV